MFILQQAHRLIKDKHNVVRKDFKDRKGPTSNLPEVQ